ncbi:response regulator [Paraburkholderia acidisoli]|uniref:Response regulator n=1 Tax=Paraburkholderia acidisoli TaxID=2571748 RepID=A0A7Z2GQX3_9BURK|nr:response regulator [Paraburkholderia acidisoli]QGZ66115.1 response regulator [Paraburkholderia acidisoli]
MTTLVIVDDESLVTEFLSFLLNGAGYEVHAAFNGRDAIALIERQRPALVITDLMMPVMSGLGLAKAIRHHDELAQLPIILCSSAPDPVTPEESLMFSAILRKPYPPNRLLELVTRFAGEAEPGVGAGDR